MTDLDRPQPSDDAFHQSLVDTTMVVLFDSGTMLPEFL
jgi:hypothetical protein